MMVQLFIAITLRKIHHTWFHPGAFFPLFWFFFSVVPLIFAPGFNVPSYGLWVVAAFSGCLAIGSLLLPTDNSVAEQGETTSIKDHQTLLNMAVATMAILAFVGVLLELRFALAKFQLNFSVFSLLLVPNEISAERYMEILAFPLYIKILNYLLFPTALFAGIGFSIAKKKWEYILYITPLIIAVIFGIIETSRFTIITTIVLWYSGVLGGRAALGKNLQKFLDKKSRLFFIVSGILFIVLFILLDWLRQAQGELLADIVFERLQAYLFGYLAAFSNWLMDGYDGNLQLGLQTFAGPLSLGDLTVRLFGSYEPVIITGDLSTNIFTALRGLIQDYSVTGAGIILVFIGYAGTATFQNVLRGKILWLVPLTLFYAFVLYSPLISLFHYNSLIMSWVMLCVFFLLARPLIGSQKKIQDYSFRSMNQ